MSIDDRLDRLTERHEALTQSVELLAQDVMKMRSVMDDTLAGIAKLLHIAEIQERRITRLEGAN